MRTSVTKASNITDIIIDRLYFFCIVNSNYQNLMQNFTLKFKYIEILNDG